MLAKLQTSCKQKAFKYVMSEEGETRLFCFLSLVSFGRQIISSSEPFVILTIPVVLRQHKALSLMSYPLEVMCHCECDGSHPIPLRPLCSGALRSISFSACSALAKANTEEEFTSVYT